VRPTNECTSTSADQLLGSWQGQASTVIAYWPEPEISDCQLKLGAAELEGLLVQPDDSFARLPERVSQREAFVLEGGWLPAPGWMERLIWRYDACGRRAAYP
jgi:hypothetical protein